MRTKLKLNVEDLAVDSFDTSRAEDKKGTVFGEQCTCYTNCTCPGCYTCDASCNGTCDASCNGTCDASCNGSCDASCYGTCIGEFTCGIRCQQGETALYTACDGVACY